MIIKSSKTLRIADIDETSSNLKPGVYLLKFDEIRHEYYFQQKENFKLPKKIYGNYDIANRWLKSYENNSEKNMGIILSGLKGTGKTIDAQKFCILSKKPVIENFYDEEAQGTIIEDLSEMKTICFISIPKAYEAAIKYALNRLI